MKTFKHLSVDLIKLGTRWTRNDNRYVPYYTVTSITDCIATTGCDQSLCGLTRIHTRPYRRPYSMSECAHAFLEGYTLLEKPKRTRRTRQQDGPSVDTNLSGNSGQ